MGWEGLAPRMGGGPWAYIQEQRTTEERTTSALAPSSSLGWRGGGRRGRLAELEEGEGWLWEGEGGSEGASPAVGASAMAQQPERRRRLLGELGASRVVLGVVALLAAQPAFAAARPWRCVGR